MPTSFEMKVNRLYYLVVFGFCLACQNNHQIKLKGPQNLHGQLIGDSVLDFNIKSTQELAEVVNSSQNRFRVVGKVQKVDKSGFWISLISPSGKEIVASFVNTNLLFPKTLVGKTVVLDGTAELKNLPLAQQKSFNTNLSKPISNVEKTKEIIAFEAMGLVILDKKALLQAKNL